MVFALSRSLPLSLAALAVVGAADVVSVVIRFSLVQLQTPDAMRSRVSAVNALFIGTSNQFGEFESGVLAALLGAVPATLLGGLGTIAVAGLWIYLFPALWRLRALDDRPWNDGWHNARRSAQCSPPNIQIRIRIGIGMPSSHKRT
jgi:hypothetical protein